MTSKGQRKHDWPLLISEFIKGKETKNEFIKKRGLRRDTFYAMLRKYKGEERREKVNERALEQSMDKAVKERAKEYEKLRSTGWSLHSFIHARMKLYVREGKDGKQEVSAMPAKDVAALFEALGKFGRLLKVLDGEYSGEGTVVNVGFKQIANFVNEQNAAAGGPPRMVAPDDDKPG